MITNGPVLVRVAKRIQKIEVCGNEKNAIKIKVNNLVVGQKRKYLRSRKYHGMERKT
jgi:hypothetical protein